MPNPNQHLYLATLDAHVGSARDTADAAVRRARDLQEEDPPVPGPTLAAAVHNAAVELTSSVGLFWIAGALPADPDLTEVAEAVYGALKAGQRLAGRLSGAQLTATEIEGATASLRRVMNFAAACVAASDRAKSPIGVAA